MQFRRTALARLDAPEALDIPVRLTRPGGWLVLAGLAAVVASGCLWAFAGTVPRDVTATGVLAVSQPDFPVQSTAAGQLTELLVRPGTGFAAGAPVATVTTGDGIRTTVRAAVAGRATAVLAKPGQFVTNGTTLANAFTVETTDDPLMAVAYVPAERSTAVGVGTEVNLAVRSVPASAFGVLRGTVLFVQHTPDTSTQIAPLLGKELAAEVTRDGPVAKVAVALRASDRTVSGYAWSTWAGPPDRLVSGSLVTATISLPPARPIEMMSP